MSKYHCNYWCNSHGCMINFDPIPKIKFCCQRLWVIAGKILGRRRASNSASATKFRYVFLFNLFCKSSLWLISGVSIQNLRQNSSSRRFQGQNPVDIRIFPRSSRIKPKKMQNQKVKLKIELIIEFTVIFYFSGLSLFTLKIFAKES